MHGTFEIDPQTGPIAVTIWFHIERPKTVKRTHPTVKPDIDKLARAILDACTNGGAWDDDSQVIELSLRKVYATTETKPGVLIHIQTLKDE